MKKTLLILACFFLLGGLQAQTKTLYDYSCQTLDNQTISLGQYAGKKLMVVNVASYCVYTPEYTPLEQLYEQYKKYNFLIIGFPSDDFDNQGGTDSEIISTCHSYDVTFAIMQEIHVATGDIAPVYQWLETDSLNGVSNATITWNFNKFLIDRQGHWVQWYDSPVSPLDTSITNWIIQDSTAGKLAYRKPSAFNDTAIILEGTFDTVNVAANDSDESGDSLCVTSVYGSPDFKVMDCSNVVYDGPANFIGYDTCWYVICTDSAPVVCDTAMLSVTVEALTNAIT